MTLRICSNKTHKGFSQFNRRMVVHELRDRLRTLDSDLVFLQEVQGLHLALHLAQTADFLVAKGLPPAALGQTPGEQIQTPPFGVQGGQQGEIGQGGVHDAHPLYKVINTGLERTRMTLPDWR